MNLQSPPNNHLLTFLALAVLVMGFVLRFTGIWYDYPLTTHPDEMTIFRNAFRIVSTGDLNPHFFQYPSLVIYLHACIIFVVSVYYDFFHGISLESIPKVEFFLAGRFVAVSASAFSIMITWLLARKLLQPASALLACALVSFSPLHLSNSHLLTTDIWVSVFTVLSLYFSVSIIRKPGLKPYLMSGFFAGLAIGSKYTAALVFTSIIFAHFYQFSSIRKLSLSQHKNLLIALLIMSVSFLATTPYAIFDHGKFIIDVLYESNHYRSGHPGAESDSNHSYINYFRGLASEQGIGLPATIFVITGFILSFKTRHRIFLIFSLFSLIYFAFIGNYKVYFLRNTVALVPVLALLAALSVEQLVTLALQKYKTGKSILYLLAYTAILFPVLEKSFYLYETYQLPDTRLLSIEWIRKNIPASSHIFREFYTPPLEEFTDNFHISQLGLSGAYQSSFSFSDNRSSYLVTSSSDYQRYFNKPDEYTDQVNYYSTLFNSSCLVYELASEKDTSKGPIIRVYRACQGKNNE